MDNVIIPAAKMKRLDSGMNELVCGEMILYYRHQ